MDLDVVFSNGEVVKRVWITPEMAKFWLENYRYEFQRNLSTEHINLLMLELINGRFNEQTTISFAKLNNVYSLIDGQHRLSAVAKSGVPINSIVCISNKKTKQEVAQAYASFDRGRTRGLSDALHIYSNDFSDITKTQSQQSGSGLRMVYSGFRYTRLTKMMTPQVTAKMVSDWSEHIKRFYACVKDSPNFFALRKGVIVGFALITFRYAEELAHEFWSQVAFEDGLRTTDARKTCIRYILKNRRGGIKQAIGQRELAVGINRTWEAFVDGRTISKVYATGKDNVIISRTPYDSTIDNCGIDLEKYVNIGLITK